LRENGELDISSVHICIGGVQINGKQGTGKGRPRQLYIWARLNDRQTKNSWCSLKEARKNECFAVCFHRVNTEAGQQIEGSHQMPEKATYHCLLQRRRALVDSDAWVSLDLELQARQEDSGHDLSNKQHREQGSRQKSRNQLTQSFRPGNRLGWSSVCVCCAGQPIWGDQRW